MQLSQCQQQTQQLHLSQKQLQINELHQKFTYQQIETMLLENPLIKCEELYNDTPDQPPQYETEDESQCYAELWESGVESEYESDEDTKEYDAKGESDSNIANDEYDTTIIEDDYNSRSDIVSGPVENNFLDYTAAPEPDFREELVEEVQCFNPPLAPDFQAICIDIIYLLMDNGFLPLSIQEVSDQCKASVKKTQKAIKFIQDHLEPPGLAARDKYEYVLLNLKRQEKDIDLYEKLFTECKDIDDKTKITQKLGISQSKLEEMFEELKKFKRILFLSSDDMSQFIEPVVEIVSVGYDDFKAYLTNNKWNFKLRDDNKGIAKETCAEAETLLYAYNQYGKILLQITNELIKVQHDFLIHGDLKSLKPCAQNWIAERLGIDPASISRVIKDEYIRTPHGIFEFQFFFKAGFTNDDGEQFTRDHAKEVLKQLIDDEDKTKPLSDEKLAALLGKELKINCSREVIKKYRKELKIGNSRKRLLT